MIRSISILAAISAFVLVLLFLAKMLGLYYFNALVYYLLCNIRQGKLFTTWSGWQNMDYLFIYFKSFFPMETCADITVGLHYVVQPWGSRVTSQLPLLVFCGRLVLLSKLFCNCTISNFANLVPEVLLASNSGLDLYISCQDFL